MGLFIGALNAGRYGRLILTKINGSQYRQESVNTFNNIQEVISVGRLPANSLVNADCLEAMKYIKDKSVDMVLCDLPYG